MGGRGGALIAPTLRALFEAQIVGLPDLGEGFLGEVDFAAAAQRRRRRLLQSSGAGSLASAASGARGLLAGSALSAADRRRMEQQQRWGLASAAAGGTAANEDAWARLTTYFKVRALQLHCSWGASMRVTGPWLLCGGARWRKGCTFALGRLLRHRGRGAQDAQQSMHWANISPLGPPSCGLQLGDWHDTLLLPLAGPPGMGCAATVRFQPGPHTGYAVAHCHYLQVSGPAGCCACQPVF